MRRLLRWSALVAGGAALIGAAGLGAFCARWDERFFTGYDPALPLAPRSLEESEVAPGQRRELLTFQVESGDRAALLLHRPDADGPLPCVVLLLWYRARVGYLEQAASEYVRQGFVVAAPEGLGFRDLDAVPQPRGLARYWSTLDRGRGAILQSRRVLDYLAIRPEVDPERVYLGGISMGGTLVPAVLAHEPRYAGGILMWTAGRLPSLIDTYVERREVGPPESWLLRAGVALLEPVEPTRWVGRLEGRPLLFQNTRGDEVLPEVSVRALHDAAREPKTVLWYEGVHERGVDEETVRRALADQVEWLRGLGVPLETRVR